MSVGKRNVYGSAFKAKVGLEAIRGVKTVHEIAQEYGVHSTQVAQWKRAIQEQAGSLPTFGGRFGGWSTPLGLPGTTRPHFALPASSGGRIVIVMSISPC